MNLHKELCRSATLEVAWQQVRASAINSASPEIRAEAQTFARSSSTQLRSLQQRLARGSFKFSPARGVLLKQSGKKKPRPIVVAPIESRIVQRAILEIAQRVPSIRETLTSGFNFGGVPGKGFGVPGAIAKAVRCAMTHGYFVRTDIRAFFTSVPRNQVVDDLCMLFGSDEQFKDIFRQAISTEIRDAEKYGEDIHLFPIADDGVAQGSSLSPLICNYLLRDFDRSLNQRGIICIRYIDDFILFGSTRSNTQKAFGKALSMLQQFGLDAYDPFDPRHAEKAEHGAAKNGFIFLGCDVRPDRVRPIKAKVELLLSRTKSIYDGCVGQMRYSERAIRSPDQIETYAGAIVAASNVVRAWGNTYSFCSDDRLMSDIDRRLANQLIEFDRAFMKAHASLSDLDQRRSLGLFSLRDCNKDSESGSARAISLSFRETKTDRCNSTPDSYPMSLPWKIAHASEIRGKAEL